MGYADLNTIHNPATGTVAPAAWGDQARDNDEFLIDPPACSVFNSTAQNITHNTLTILTADSEKYDNNAMHSTVSNTSRITCQTAGRYLIVAKVNFAGNNVGDRLIGLLLNGVSVDDTQLPTCANAAFNTGFIYMTTLVLAATDYIEVRARQTSTVTLGATLLEFAATYLTR